MEKIVFVGDKPSAKNIDPNVPFVGTQSYKRLLDWIFRMNIDISDVIMINKDTLYGYGTIDFKFIALGNEAEKALKNHSREYWDVTTNKPQPLKANYFKLPHPSGLNRKINDKNYLDNILKECSEWLKE